MAEDWAVDVKKYVPDADENAIAGIVRYCGIALTKRDSSLVSMSDKKETDRVRENFLKKKLGRTESDAVLDAEIQAVGERMKADRTKNRVTVYYLLAEKFNSLPLFHKASNAKAKAPAKAAGAAATKPAAKAAPKAKAPAKPKVKAAGAAAAAGGAALGLAALSSEGSGGTTSANDDGVGAKAAAALGAAGAAVTGAASVAADTASTAAAKVGDTAGAAGAAVVGAAGAAVAGAAALADRAGDAVGGAASGLASTVTGDDEGSGSWLWWLLAGLLALFAIWWFFLRGPSDVDTAAAPAATETAAATTAASGAATDLTAAPAEGSVAIPAGAGVTSEMRDGKPVVKVYFASGKTDIVPDFAAAAGGLKAYLASHPGSSLAITGYADPSGNAAFNAELSKKRAEAVQASLVGAGIAQTSTELVKPADSTDATVDRASARRVEVVVR